MHKRSGLFFFFLIYIYIFVFIGFFAFPSADDYAFINRVNINGFWGAQYSWYTSWTGRFFNTFYVSLFTLLDKVNLFFKSYAFLSLFLILFSYISLCFCIYSAASNVFLKKLTKKHIALIALFFQALWLSQMPSLNETLYWLAGSPYYMTCSVILLETGFLFQLLREKNIVRDSLILSGLFFLNWGMMELGAVFATIALFVFILFLFYRKNTKKIKLLILPMIFNLLGFFVVYLAPGTAIRLKAFVDLGFSPQNIFTTIKGAVFWGMPVALSALLSPLKYILLLFLPDLNLNAASVREALSPIHKKFTIKLALILTIVGACCFQAIGVYATGDTLPLRGIAFIQWALWFAWIIYFVILFDNRQFSAVIKRTTFYQQRYLLLFVFLLLSINTRNALVSIPGVKQYHAENVHRAYLMENASPDEVVRVPLLKNRNRLLFFADLALANDKDFWIAHAMEGYYGIKKIQALPWDVFYQDKEGDFTQKNFFEFLSSQASQGNPQALLEIGRVYDFGYLDKSKDIYKAETYYIKASQLGENKARRSLGRIYLRDARRERDYIKGIKYTIQYLFSEYILGIS